MFNDVCLHVIFLKLLPLFHISCELWNSLICGSPWLVFGMGSFCCHYLIIAWLDWWRSLFKSRVFAHFQACFKEGEEEQGVSEKIFCLQLQIFADFEIKLYPFNQNGGQCPHFSPTDFSCPPPIYCGFITWISLNLASLYPKYDLFARYYNLF